LIKPVASVKKLLVTLTLGQDLPVYAVGDEKRLMQTILNVVGNAVKFSKEGSISITAFVAKSESLRDSRAQDFFLVPSDNHFYLRVQVRFFNTLLKSFSLRMLSCFMLKASCVCLPFLFNCR
jgi:ethylene receptor